MSEPPPVPDQSPENERPSLSPPPVVSAEDLFRGQREIWIEHEGVRYRLRITRRNKLILQK
jgi:hemin uptake protein HemP